MGRHSHHFPPSKACHLLTKKSKYGLLISMSVYEKNVRYEISIYKK